MRAAVSLLIRRIAEAAVGVLLPEACPLCGRETPPSGGIVRACADCEARVPMAEAYCARCSAPVGPFLDTANGCGHCRHDRFAFESVYSAAEYRDAVRSAVLAAKRAGGGPAAAWLADRLWERRGAELLGLGVDLVVPIPQHWTRRVTAPHNPAELLARRLAARLRVPVEAHILTKTRRTPAQAALVPSARRANLRGVFLALRPLHGRRVLLVDDVLTTGTTADRASRALFDADAAAVWVAAAARGIGV